MERNNDFLIPDQLTAVGNRFFPGKKGQAAKLLLHFLKTPELWEGFWKWLIMSVKKTTVFKVETIGRIKIDYSYDSPLKAGDAVGKSFQFPKGCDWGDGEGFDCKPLGEYEISLITLEKGVFDWDLFYHFVVHGYNFLSGEQLPSNQRITARYSLFGFMGLLYCMQANAIKDIPTGIPVVFFTPHGGVTLRRPSAYNRLKGDIECVYPGIDVQAKHFIAFKLIKPLTRKSGGNI